MAQKKFKVTSACDMKKDKEMQKHYKVKRQNLTFE